MQINRNLYVLNGKHRRLAVRHIMESEPGIVPDGMCEEGFNRRSITDLPEEILEYIFFKVSPYNDLTSVMLVCSAWYRVAKGIFMYL